MPSEMLKAENGQSGNKQGSATADLRALLQLGGRPGAGQTTQPGRSGPLGRPGRTKPRILAYDKDTLLAISKNLASRTRPDFLDPEYDTSHNPPRWDPDRWHSGTKPKARGPKPEATGIPQPPTGAATPLLKNKNDENWRKLKDVKRTSLNELEPEFDKNENSEGPIVLGPQRRSYKEGKRFLFHVL